MGRLSLQLCIIKVPFLKGDQEISEDLTTDNSFLWEGAGKVKPESTVDHNQGPNIHSVYLHISLC